LINGRPDFPESVEVHVGTGLDPLGWAKMQKIMSVMPGN